MKDRVGVERPDVGNLILLRFSAVLCKAHAAQHDRLQDADRVGRGDVLHHRSGGLRTRSEGKDEIAQASFDVLTQRRQTLFHRAEGNRL